MPAATSRHISSPLIGHGFAMYIPLVVSLRGVCSTRSLYTNLSPCAALFPSTNPLSLLYLLCFLSSVPLHFKPNEALLPCGPPVPSHAGDRAIQIAASHVRVGMAPQDHFPRQPVTLKPECPVPEGPCDKSSRCSSMVLNTHAFSDTESPHGYTAASSPAPRSRGPPPARPRVPVKARRWERRSALSGTSSRRAWW